METLIKKITSRKFLTCIAGFVMGVCIAFGADENAIGVIVGAMTSAASAVSYIVIEGKIDAAAVGNAANNVMDAIDTVEKIED